VTERAARARRRNLVLAGAGVLLLLAMVFPGTTVVSQADAQQAKQEGLDPVTWAKKEYADSIVPAIVKDAVPIVEVAEAIKQDPQAAAEQYGNVEGSSDPVFSVTATGTAGKAEASGLMPLEVPGMPKGVDVYVQMGPAINGTALRDATGTVHFGMFVNQLAYQKAGTALNDQVKAEVLADTSAKDLKGEQVTVTGVFQLTNPDAYILTPVKLEQSR
jgi:predicted lipoprotein